MKKSILLTVLVLCQFIIVFGQDSYKQNFLNALKILPLIKTCGGSYDFLKGKDNANGSFFAAKSNLAAAIDKLTSAENAVSNDMTSGMPVTSMSEADADAMAAKMDKMSDAEKQQWAMQNAMTMMNPAAVHSNQDANNDVVNDAVEYIHKQQDEELKDITKTVNVSMQLQSIDDKYRSQKVKILETFQKTTNTSWDPSSPSPYVFGEASPAELAKFDQAEKTYKDEMIPVLDAELNEKITYMNSLGEKLISKYSTLQLKVAATHYGDDAQENMNKNLILMSQQTILSSVSEIFDNYDQVLHEYANKYADLQKKERVK
jgi:hypothetical protein